jgi:uncharacterized membrane protein
MATSDLALSLNILYGIILLFMGLFFAILTYPLMKGTVKMNHMYGVRFPQSYYSDEAWYQINVYGGKLFMVWGILLAIAGALILFIPITDYVVGLIIFLALMGTMLVPIGLTYNYARTFNP